MPTGQTLIEHIHNTPVIPGSLGIWGLGQMGVIVKGTDATLVIDPYLTNSIGDHAGEWWARGYAPPLMPDELRGVDYYLASHEHGDHLDTMTAAPASLASPDMQFVTSGWCVDKLLNRAQVDEGQIIVPTAFEPMMLPGTSARLTVIPSAHYEKEYEPDKGYRWLGFLIEWNGVTFYHSGDTVIYPGYLESLHSLPTADVAMIPVNGRDWYRETGQNAVGNLTPEEAPQLALDAGWDMVIIGHNDLFPNNAIPNGRIVDAFDRYAPRQKFKFLQPGELYYYVK